MGVLRSKRLESRSICGASTWLLTPAFVSQPIYPNGRLRCTARKAASILRLRFLSEKLPRESRVRGPAAKG